MLVWKCEECGSVHSFADPPEACPGCGTPREHFVQVHKAEPQPLWSSRGGQNRPVAAAMLEP